MWSAPSAAGSVLELGRRVGQHPAAAGGMLNGEAEGRGVSPEIIKSPQLYTVTFILTDVPPYFPQGRSLHPAISDYLILAAQQPSSSFGPSCDVADKELIAPKCTP